MVGDENSRLSYKLAVVGHGQTKRVVGEYCCYVNIVEALNRCSPAPRYGELHTGFVEIRDPRRGHPLHAYIHQCK